MRQRHGAAPVRNLPFMLALLAACSVPGPTIVVPPIPPPPPPPPVVASVAVSLASSMFIGGTQGAAAAARDASGGAIVGRAITWSSSTPAVATINSNGTIVGVAAGSTTIGATIDGVTGGAALTVTAAPPLPVTSIAIYGLARVKAGGPYAYTVVARRSDGSTATSPVTWAVIGGPGTITAAGVLTPTGSGAVTIRATVEGYSSTAAVTAYDWTPFSGVGIIGASLPADALVTNQFGTAEYPLLTVGCSLGVVDLHVLTQNVITKDGVVAYAFDGGAATIAMWTEIGPYYGEQHPGPNTAAKALAVSIAAANVFGFSFTEYSSVARSMTFRVTGLSALLAPILGACPG